MDRRIEECPALTTEGREFLHRVEAGLALTADVSRADVLLCCLHSSRQALVASHASPRSIASLYPQDATGRLLDPEDQPLLMRALRHGVGGHRQHEVESSNAPIIQYVHPVCDRTGRTLGALLVETNLFAHERHRRRHHGFRQAVDWLQQMAARGELACAGELSRFGLYDGVYLVDRNRYVTYMSGIASNLFRSVGFTDTLQGQKTTALDTIDEEMVERVFRHGTCLERRQESEDGIVWVRKAIPLRRSPSTLSSYWPRWPWFRPPVQEDGLGIDAVLVLIHNATEAVQRQRELNVKAAMIQEVHHRVKNNLQTIAAILRIQARRAEQEETRQHLTGAVNRILSMSVIHEFLSHDEHRSINIRDVCQRIGDQVTRVAGSPEQEIEIQVRGPNIRLPASQATPMAMVINELLLNAMEHGLAGLPHGRVDVELSDLGDAVRVVVEDDGSGLPPDFDPVQSKSLGLQIVHTLVTDDLKGELQMTSARDEATAAQPGRGTRAVVTFPKRPLTAD
jgi:two-component sensor histidine kinase